MWISDTIHVYTRKDGLIHGFMVFIYIYILLSYVSGYNPSFFDLLLVFELDKFTWFYCAANRTCINVKSVANKSLQVSQQYTERCMTYNFFIIIIEFFHLYPMHLNIQFKVFVSFLKFPTTFILQIFMFYHQILKIHTLYNLLHAVEIHSEY